MNPTKQLINSSGNHTVQICLTENSQVDSVTHFVKEGLSNEGTVFIIAKPALRKILKSKMDALSFDGQPFQEPEQIRFFDAEFLLSCLKSKEGLEERTFQQIVAAPIIKAQSEYKKVRAFGEMVDILGEQSEHDIAIQLEGFWKNLTNTQNLSFLCTYSLNRLSIGSYDEALERICKFHPHLTPQEDKDLMEQGIGETMLNVFGVAWNRVINKLTNTPQIPRTI